MLLSSFLAWFEDAPAVERVEAAGMLADAFLDGGLDGESEADAEAALMLVLDDPAVSVRRALARRLAASEAAPRAVIVSLAQEGSEVSALVLARSPLLRDADLVACVASGDALAHVAIASRLDLTTAVSAALITHAGAEAIRILLDNVSAPIEPAGYRSLAGRFGDDAGVRGGLHQRSDLPADVRHRLVAAVSKDLAGFVGLTGLIAPNRAGRLFSDAQEAATIELARTTQDIGGYVTYLRASGQLTPGLLLRALMAGDTSLFGMALTELTGLPPRKIAGLVSGRSPGALAAVCERAGLPLLHIPAFLAALRVLRGRTVDPDAPLALDRTVIGAAMAACLDQNEDAVRPLLAMLRRLDADAARDEARTAARRMRAAPPVMLAPEMPAEALALPPPVDLDQLHRDLRALSASLTLPAAEALPAAAPALSEPDAGDDLEALMRSTFGPLRDAPPGDQPEWEPLRVVGAQDAQLDEAYFAGLELRRYAA